MFYFFDRFRQLGNDPYDTSLIRFYTPTPHSTNMYCMGNYNGIDATALIDGRMKQHMQTMNMFQNSNMQSSNLLKHQYISIDFTFILSVTRQKMLP